MVSLWKYIFFNKGLVYFLMEHTPYSVMNIIKFVFVMVRIKVTLISEGLLYLIVCTMCWYNMPRMHYGAHVQV